MHAPTITIAHFLQQKAHPVGWAFSIHFALNSQNATALAAATFSESTP